MSWSPGDPRLRVSTDGFGPYWAGVGFAFGGNVEHGILIKRYRNADQKGRYAPPELIHADRIPITPGMGKRAICTSHIERCNLSLRTFLRRFTRLSLGFSKKLDNLVAAVSLFVAHYDFCRYHSTIRSTPAMAAGIAGHPWTMAELLDAAAQVERGAA
jgi:hypothetical protein